MGCQGSHQYTAGASSAAAEEQHQAGKLKIFGTKKSVCLMVSKEQNNGLSVEIYIYVQMAYNQDLAGYKPKKMRLIQAFFWHDGTN